MMGGDIRVESPGQLKDEVEGAPGATFHFNVILGVKEGEHGIGEPVDIQSLKGVHALIVDDNCMNREIFRENLCRWGLEPECADSGEKALETLKDAASHDKKFKLILMDVRMPGMDGYSTVEAINRDEEIKDVQIVMLTSSGSKGDGKRCTDLGVAAYMKKPIRPSELLETILIVMGGAKRKKKDTPLITIHSLRESRTKISVLVAEDNLVNQKLISRILEKRGADVTIANDGKAAVEKFAASRYDIVLMDIQMPEMGGVEATKEIRKWEKESGNPRTPIVALTAHAMKGDKERFLQAGMDNYISKPLKQNRLLKMMEELLRGVEG
jgi:CheY-like chemotaxis protein